MVVEHDGEVVAESTRPYLLFESMLPVRYYLPMTDVDQRLLRPSPVITRCPYKGEAAYYSIPAGGERSVNAIWTYEAPIPEVAAIAGHLAFYPAVTVERV